jgi:hypothetical protein
MRRLVQLAASLTLLATQVNVPQVNFGNIAAADKAPAASTDVYEVKLNTNTDSPVTIVDQNQHDYDSEVLNPLHAAQAEAAAQAAQAATARRKAVKKATALRATVVVTGSHADWMRAAGISESDFGYVDYIIGHESGWVCTKYNYAGSGAYGLGQAYPAGKMAGYGSDYMTNPVTQLKWANAYALSRYGSWANAYAHWLSRHSW